MHGGRIEARSEGRGKGSEFIVRLPLVVEASGPKAAERAEEHFAAKSSLRILIVDDKQTVRTRRVKAGRTGLTLRCSPFHPTK
jgi:hypothetical protein